MPCLFEEDAECRMVSQYIFKKIFDSQMSNNDTVCCVAAHIVSKIMMEFVNSNGLMDHSIDVTDFSNNQLNQTDTSARNIKDSKTNKDDKKIEKPALKRAQDLANFIKEILEDIINNRLFKG